MILGIDEAGRGALAGPLVVAGACLDTVKTKALFKDSKTLSFKQRSKLYDEEIKGIVPYWGSVISIETIDRINVLAATMRGMSRVIQRCTLSPTQILIDGNRIPPNPTEIPIEAIVKGDQLIAEISCASIIAKVIRDRIMIRAMTSDPRFAFDTHFGYGTTQHYNEIEAHGILKGLHRKSFKLFKPIPLIKMV